MYNPHLIEAQASARRTDMLAAAEQARLARKARSARASRSRTASARRRSAGGWWGAVRTVRARLG